MAEDKKTLLEDTLRLTWEVCRALDVEERGQKEIMKSYLKDALHTASGIIEQIVKRLTE